MTSEEYFELSEEIGRIRTTDEVRRMRNRIREFPDDDVGYRKSLFHSLAQHAADADIMLPVEREAP